MKPILLTMQAFGSYGEKTEIDFQKGGDFFLISGDTGSGKSTIFDAMMFALYGEVSTNGSGKENELLSQFVDVRNDKPLVSLVFTAHQHGQEETYKITRTPRHIRPAKRTGAKQQEEGETAELLMPDGSQYPGKLSDTNRKIEELVGLTADQFRKVVMIAQGEFMDFLRAGSKEKTELLRDLLKTDYYYQLSERLKTLAKDKNTAAKTQRANMSFFAGRAVTEGLPEEDAQALKAAKGTVITAKELQPEQVDALVEVLSGVCARLQLQQGELAKQQTAAQNDRDECMKCIEAAKPLMDRFEELESAEKTLQECAAQADEIEKKRGLIGKIRDAWAIEPKYQRMKDAQKALTDAQRELAAKQQELPQLKQTAADAAAFHQQMEKTKDAATTQCAEVETKVEKALKTFDALDEAWSQWMDALRKNRTKEYIPENMLPRNPLDGKVLKPNAFDNAYIQTDGSMAEGTVNKIELVQGNIPHESYLATYITALDLCLQGIMSPSTLGIDVKKLDNAEAQREKEKATLYSRNNIVEQLQKVLPKLVTATFNAIDTLNKTAIKDIDIDVTFGEYANPSFESQVETVSKAKQGGIMSIEASVDELYGDTKDDEWKQEEIARLKAEQGISDMEEPALNMQADGFSVDGADNSFTGFDNK